MKRPTTTIADLTKKRTNVLKGMTMFEVRVGDIIHVVSSNADRPRYCALAFLGGAVAGNWWALVLKFSQSNTTWLSDVEWHIVDDCQEDSGALHNINHEGRTV